MSLDPRSDMAWTAARYALGELPDADCLAFEALLADDQVAREALADAVDLLGAMAIVVGEQPLAMPVRHRRFAVWATLASAACLIAVAVGLNSTWRASRPDPTEVARAWSDLRTGADAEWSALVEAQHPVSVPETESGMIDVESATDRPLPSWLLTAASAPKAGPVVEEN